MSEPLLQTPAVITKITTMSGDGVRLQVDTQEGLTPIAQAMIFGYYNKLGVFAFSKSKIEEKELIIPDYKPTTDEQKTPSQRLRGVLYLLWQQRGKKDLYGQPCDSDTYYKQTLERIIDAYKEKLQ